MYPEMRFFVWTELIKVLLLKDTWRVHNKVENGQRSYIVTSESKLREKLDPWANNVQYHERRLNLPRYFIHGKLEALRLKVAKLLYII